MNRTLDCAIMQVLNHGLHNVLYEYPWVKNVNLISCVFYAEMLFRDRFTKIADPLIISLNQTNCFFSDLAIALQFFLFEISGVYFCKTEYRNLKYIFRHTQSYLKCKMLILLKVFNDNPA